MKSIHINRKSNKLIQLNRFFYHALVATVFILPIFLSACGSKLGNIESKDVDSLILQAEMTIEAARAVSAPSLAFEDFEEAETYLEKAKDALKNREGFDAIKFANRAITKAEIAKRKAGKNKMNAEHNANIIGKDALIAELQKQLKSSEKKLTDLDTKIQQYSETEQQLRQDIQTLENEKKEIGNNKKVHEQKIAELRASLKSIQAQASRSETEVSNFGTQIENLSKKVKAAETMAKSESRQKRAAIAETESLKKQLREQAKTYTNLLAEAKKRNVAAEHAEFLRKQEEKARAYVRQLDSDKPKRTGRTSLSTQQINAGKAALTKWHNAWNNKKLTAHFALYTPTSKLNQIIVRESKEHKTSLDKTKVETKLREMNAQGWATSDKSTEVEQDSVIGIYRLSRLVSAPAKTEDDTALYDIWIREVWMRQVQGTWKIYRETWQIYENIPKL